MATRSDWRQHYEHYRRAVEMGFWLVIAALTTWVNAESTLADYSRLQHSIASWQPYIWEASSQLSLLLLLPLLLIFDRRCPLSHPQWLKHLGAHLLATLVFSSLHIIFMVLMRKAAYTVAGQQYDFGAWGTEFFYEYRKDFFNYWQIIITIYAYRFIVSRLYSEAHEISESESASPSTQRFLVKKLGREFLIHHDDIDWIEAAGNYMNLHVGERVYPLRATMAELSDKLADKFVRVHRSYMVNIAQIDSVTPQNSGDYKITLKNGQQVNLSRRYRCNLQPTSTNEF